MAHSRRQVELFLCESVRLESGVAAGEGFFLSTRPAGPFNGVASHGGLMAEGQVLQDAISVGWSQQRGLSQRPSAFGPFAVQQMPSACPAEQHFPVSSYLEAFSYRFPGFNSFGTSHTVSLPWLTSCPVLRPPAVLSRRTGEFQDLGRFPAHSVLDDFTQGNVRGAEIGNVRHEWPAPASAVI